MKESRNSKIVQMFQRNFHAYTFENVFMFSPSRISLRKVSHAAQKLMSPLFFSSNRPCCNAEQCRKKSTYFFPIILPPFEEQHTVQNN